MRQESERIARGRSVHRHFGRLSRAVQPVERLERRQLLTSTAAYTFQNAVIGGGGLVDGIVYSPTQSGIAYARTDTGGAYKWNSTTNTWSPLLDSLGPADSGDFGVLSLAVDPENANNVYLATGSGLTTPSQEGAVVYSNNAGSTFSVSNLPIFLGGDADGRSAGERLAVDPNDSSILFLGTSQNGLYESTNGAVTWTQVSGFTSSVSATAGLTFVLFDPTSGSPDSPSQTIYAGVDTTTATSLYVSHNGGSSWSAITGEPTGLIPNHAALASDGNLYLTYADAMGPNGMTTGNVWRYNTSSLVWTDITPSAPDMSTTFGYSGLAIDPEHQQTVMVSTEDLSGGDQIYRTTDASSTATGGPTWVIVGNTPKAIHNFYPQYAWLSPDGAAVNDGTLISAIAIDPFNDNDVMYGNSQGVWSSTDMTNADTSPQDTVAWTFTVAGLEDSDVNKVLAPATGVPLISAIDTIGGFDHTTLTTSPIDGAFEPDAGTVTGIDYAQDNPNVVVRAYASSHDGAYSFDNGVTWTRFADSPESGAHGGSIAVAADYHSLVYSVTDSGTYYSDDFGVDWSAATGTPDSATASFVPVSDRVNSNYFYIYDQTTGTLDFSNSGGQSFVPGATGLPIGSAQLAALPDVAGDLWLGTVNGLYHSTNFGKSFKQVGTEIQDAQAVGFGMPEPGKSYPTIFIWAEISSVWGIYRSIDEGNTWTRITKTTQQYGQINSLAGDPNVFGRVYVGTATNGVLIGQPATSVPSGYVDHDLGGPGSPGFAIDNAGTWTDGGGGELEDPGDQFNFAYRHLNGSASLEAEVLSVSDTSATAQAGVMSRASTAPSSAYASVLRETGDKVVFQYRKTNGGTTETTTIKLDVSTFFVKLVRSGSNFTGYYSIHGTVWHKIAKTESITAIPTLADAGIAVTAGANDLLSTAVLEDVTVS
jgi:hypothetical protein